MMSHLTRLCALPTLPMRLFAASSTLLLLSSASASPPSLLAPLSCGPSGPAYSVELSGAPLFSSPPALRAHIGGAWRVGADWLLVRAANASGTDGLGAFSGAECDYALASAPGDVVLSLGAYAYASAAAASQASLVRFRLSWPSGATGTNHSELPSGATQSTIANFPAFATPAAGFPLPHIQTWNDAFFAPSQSMPDAYGQRGGPVIYFGADASGAVVVLSPLDQFLTSSLGDALGAGASCKGAAGGSVGCWVAGTAAVVTALPAGHSHSWLLTAGGAGITDTVAAWGAVLRAQYGSTSTKLADGTLTTLGYQTDNGAQLCFGCPGQVLDKCLLDEKASLDALGVPTRYLSFQNAWWKSGGESAPWCVGEWEAVPAKVPMGIPAFQAELGLPLQLYAPYFCATSSYPSNFSMVRSDTKLPGCGDFDFYDAAPDSSRLFYDFLFDLGVSYGMEWFEPDFLNANHMCVPAFIEHVGAADAFFDGQASAALARGIPIQWCFCTPYLLMWTLGAPAVTNFRVSYDFYYGSSWDVGRSSLLVAAMGGAPSKDTFWTSDNGAQATTRGGCDKTGCPPDHTSVAAVLHTMLTVLSTGPVGFSDAPGETDAALILRSCDANGTLLQPSRPITAVDSTWAAAGAPDGGFVLGTHTALAGAGVAAHIFVSHQLKTPFALRAADAWPRLDAAAALVSAARARTRGNR